METHNAWRSRLADLFVCLRERTYVLDVGRGGKEGARWKVRVNTKPWPGRKVKVSEGVEISKQGRGDRRGRRGWRGNHLMKDGAAIRVWLPPADQARARAGGPGRQGRSKKHGMAKQVQMRLVPGTKRIIQGLGKRRKEGPAGYTTLKTTDVEHTSWLLCLSTLSSP